MVIVYYCQVPHAEHGAGAMLPMIGSTVGLLIPPSNTWVMVELWCHNCCIIIGIGIFQLHGYLTGQLLHIWHVVDQMFCGTWLQFHLLLCVIIFVQISQDGFNPFPKLTKYHGAFWVSNGGHPLSSSFIFRVHRTFVTGHPICYSHNLPEAGLWRNPFCFEYFNPPSIPGQDTGREGA